MDYNTQFLAPETKMPEDVARERAAVYSVTDSLPPEETALDLQQGGQNSSSQRQVEDRVFQERELISQQAKKEAIVDPELTDDEKLATLREPISFDIDYRQMLAESLLQSTEGMSRKEVNIQLNKVLQQHGTTLRDELQQFKKAKYMHDRAITSQLAKEVERLAKAQIGISPSVSGAVADTFGEMIPLNTQQLWVGLHDHMYGESPDFDETILVGRVQEKLKDTIKQLPLSERGAFMKEAADWIISNSGFREGDNDVQALHAINDLLEDAISGGDQELSEYINSFVGVIDTVSVGTPLAKVVKNIFSGIRSAFLGPVFSVNTKKAKDIARAISDHEISPSDIGVDGNLLDAATISSREAMPNSFVRQLHDAEAVAKEVADDLSHNTLMHSDDNLSLLKKDYEKVIDETYPTNQKAEIEILPDGDNLKAKIVVTNTEEAGFASVREAVEDAQKYSDDFIVKMKLEDGSYMEITNPQDMLDEVGDFVYELNHTMSKSDLARFGSQTIAKEDLGMRWLPNTMHKYFTDSTSGLGKRLSQAIDASTDMSEGAQARVRDVLKPFMKLSASSQHNVVFAVNRFIKEGKEITPSAIDVLPLSAREKEGLWAYKLTNEVLHHLFDDRLVRNYVAEGVRRVSIPYVMETGEMGAFNSYGKKAELNSIPFHNESTKIYNYQTDTIESLSRKRVEELYENGNFLVRVKEDLGDSKVVSNYVLATPETQLKDLPKNILNHRNAYGSARYHTNKLYVREKRTITRNGKESPFFTARAGADDWVSANKQRERLLEEFPDKKFEITYARELTPPDARKLDEDILMTRGQIGFSKRADNSRPGGVDGLNSIEDPMVSTAKSLQAVADKNTRGDVIEWLENQWRNTYGQLTAANKEAFVKGDFGYPDSVAKIKTLIDQPDLQEEAIKLFNKIETMKRIHLSDAADAQKSLFLSWARKITADGTKDGLIRTTISKGLINFSDKPAETYIKALPFWFYIAGNPTRQYLLQSQQSMFVASMLSAKDPIGAAKILAVDSHRLGLAYQALRFSNPAKVFPDKEMLELAKQYKKAGLHEALAQSGIASEVNIREAKGIVKPTIGQRLSPTNLVKSPWLAGKYGMLAGEAVHQRTAYLTAHKLFKIENGVAPSSRADWQGVAARARQLALSMQSQSTFGFQRGLAGLATQFMSVQMKGIYALTTNPAYKGYRKPLLASYAALYGTRTIPGVLPLMERHFNEVDMPPEIRAGLKGGLVDGMFMALTDKHYEISKNFAVTGGLGMSTINYLEGFTGQQGKQWYEAIPASGAWGNLYKFLFEKSPILIGAAFQGRDAAQSIKDFATEYGRLGSGFSNYTQARASYNINELVTKKGMPTGIQFSDPIDYVMRGAFGIKTNTEEEAWRLVKELGFSRHYTQEDLDHDKNYYAKVWREIMVNGDTMLDKADDYEDITQNMLNELSALENYIKMANPDYGEIIAREAQMDIMTTEGEKFSDIIFKLIRKQYKGGMSQEDARDLINQVRGVNNLSPEQNGVLEDVVNEINNITLD